MEKKYLKTRLDELESKVAFLEITLETLNQSLIEQQFILDKLTYQLRLVAEKMSLSRGSNIAKFSEETPPPHY